MTSETHVLERMLTDKKELVRLFVIAAVLAFSVGILGSLFVEQKSIPQGSVLAIALFLLLLSFCLLARDLNSGLSFTEEAEALVFYRPETKEIVPVKDYRFAEQLSKTLRAIKAESKAMYTEWEKEPLVESRKDVSNSNSPEESGERKTSYIAIVKITVDPETRKPPRSARLLEEIASFVILEELSLHLSTYFNDAGEDSLIKEYNRNDIPDFLLKNRVLNLLSTPIEQRDIFLNAYPDGKNKPDGEIYSLWGSDGSVYSRFDLVLPKGSSIKHSDDGAICIETKRLRLELSARFTGPSGVVTRSFCSNYLCEDYEQIKPLKISIRLSGHIKPLSLLLSSGWQYYRWLDSFRERLKTSFDFPTFQNEIHWPLIEPLLFSMKRLRKQETSFQFPKKETGTREK